MSKRISALDAELRSQMFLQLATLEAAGVNAERAMEILASTGQGQLGEQAAKTLQRMRGRLPLAKAAKLAGLFSPWEVALVTAGTEGGQMAAIYRYLAQYHERNAQRSQRLRSRMTLPLAVLVLGLLTSPLPGLVRGDFGMAGFFARSLLPLLAGWWLWRLLRGHWQRAQVQNLELPGERLLVGLPWIGTLLTLIRQCQGLSILALMLSAGLPLERALKLVAEGLRAPDMRRDCEAAANFAGGGGDAALAINLAGLCTESYGKGLIQAGAITGKLAEGIAHAAREMDERITLQLDHIGQWLPRVLYFSVAIFFAF